MGAMEALKRQGREGCRDMMHRGGRRVEDENGKRRGGVDGGVDGRSGSRCGDVRLGGEGVGSGLGWVEGEWGGMKE